MEMRNVLHIHTREELRRWLAEHHALEKECWVVCKRGKPPEDGGLWYVDAVEEALCFGWVDSTLKRDEQGVPIQRFTPRGKGSHWSELNKARVRRMESLGQITSAGRAAAPAPGPFQADSDILTALQSDPDVWEGFLSAPALYRRIRIDNIQSYRADKQLYRERLDKLITASKEQRLYGEWNDHERLTAFAHDYFLYTEHIGFSFWSEVDLPEARLLWGAPEVTNYICARGRFTDEEVQERLKREISTYRDHGVQYWPLYRRSDSELIGCCGLHPYKSGVFELGVHLRPMFWRQGFAVEAANAAIRYAFDVLGAKSLFAGHNPHNTASQRVLSKLGFQYVRDEYFEPTGLYHPSYTLSLRQFGNWSNRNNN